MQRCGKPFVPGSSFATTTAYTFLHDRVQQAAYSLIPESSVPRPICASAGAAREHDDTEQLAEHLFDVVNQFNRGAARLNRLADEKAQVAALDLRAGRSAPRRRRPMRRRCGYFAAGMALLGRGRLGQPVRVDVRLWLERAECEFLTVTSTTPSN